MKYPCPNCGFGDLKPIKVTLTRLWQGRLVVVPDFSAWRCDSCSHTRYDVAALAQLDQLFGPDENAWTDPSRRVRRPTEGPAEQGPRRWQD